MRPYVGQARKFLARNGEHPAVLAGRRWVDRLLAGGSPIAVGGVAQETRALRKVGVSADQVLEVALAFQLLTTANPERVGAAPQPDALVVLGMELMKLKRDRRQGTCRDRREIDRALGDAVWNGLCPLLINAVSAERRAWSAEARLQELMAMDLPARLESATPEDPQSKGEAQP
ncbi:MAG: hypothetical protein ACX98W_13025 [bacterium]